MKEKKKRKVGPVMKTWLIILAAGVFYIYRDLLWGGCIVYGVLASISFGIRWLIWRLKQPITFTVRIEQQGEDYMERFMKELDDLDEFDDLDDLND